MLESSAPNRFNNSLRLDHEWRLSERIDLVNTHTSAVQTDAEFARASLLSGAKYNINRSSFVSAQAGPVIDRLRSYQDAGLGIAATAETENTWVQDVLLSAAIDAEMDLLAHQRQNADIDAFARAVYADQGGGSMSVEAKYGRTNRDYYTSLLSSRHIATRQEQLVAINLVLNYPVGKDTWFYLATRGDMKSVTRFDRTPLAEELSLVQREYDESALAIEAVFSTSYNEGHASLGVLVETNNHDNTVRRRFDAEDETLSILRDRFARLDNSQAFRSVFTHISQQVGNRDTLSMSASVGLLRYDTPSSENVDDRDELRYAAGLYWRRSFSQFLHFEVAAELDLFHKVYVFSESSAQNNWNRVIRLAPTVSVVSGPVVNAATFEVLANYTTYDFENTSALPRSFSLRQLRLRDSLTVQLSSSEFFIAEGTLRFFDRSVLYWNTFSESPFETNTEYSVSLLLGSRRVPRVTIGAGVLLYNLNKEPLQGGKTIQRQTIGPQIQAELRLFENTVVDFDFWYEFVFDGEFEIRRLPFVRIESRVEF